MPPDPWSKSAGAPAKKKDEKPKLKAFVFQFSGNYVNFEKIIYAETSNEAWILAGAHIASQLGHRPNKIELIEE